MQGIQCDLSCTRRTHDNQQAGAEQAEVNIAMFAPDRIVKLLVLITDGKWPSQCIAGQMVVFRDLQVRRNNSKNPLSKGIEITLLIYGFQAILPSSVISNDPRNRKAQPRVP
jgi:hypothetical protein